MIRIGGTHGAGKSTVATRPARLPPAAPARRRLDAPAARAELLSVPLRRALADAALPPFPFACECGRAGCTAFRPGTPDDVETAAAGPVTTADHGHTPDRASAEADDPLGGEHGTTRFRPAGGA